MAKLGHGRAGRFRAFVHNAGALSSELPHAAPLHALDVPGARRQGRFKRVPRSQAAEVPCSHAIAILSIWLREYEAYLLGLGGRHREPKVGEADIDART